MPKCNVCDDTGFFTNPFDQVYSCDHGAEYRRREADELACDALKTHEQRKQEILAEAYRRIRELDL